MPDFEQQIGPFRLYSEVGRTPISNKYRATDSRSGETVALHILTADAAQQPTVVQQFLTIGRCAMRLRHPGIVPIVDTGEAQGFVYVATQWARGQSLGERLRRTGRTVDIETAAYVVNALAATLDYAHSQGFTHGHITLDQIYITDDNGIMLDGFAEAVRLTLADRDQDGKTVSETITNPLVFISPFIAPEQAQRGNNFDFRVDIYSLGAVLYTMLLGRPPFVAEESGELLAQIVERQPAPPEMINPSLPAPMIYVLKLVLAKDPTLRYASAGEFASAFLQSTQWSAIIRADKAADTNKRRGFTPVLLFSLVALLSFVVIVGAGFGWFGDRFAFLQRSDGTGLLAQVGDLWPQAAIPGQAMDDPTALTPVVLLIATPPMTLPIEQPTVLSTVTITSEAVTQISGIVESPAISATTADSIATDALATPIVVEVPTLAMTATIESATNTSEAASSLVIDPFGLLVDAVTAGEVVINGTAAPGAPIQLQVNGRNSGSTTTKATGTWSFIVSLEQPGDYEIIAQMLDGNGGVTATTQRTVTVTNETEAQSIPLTATATITTPVVVSATATSTALPTATLTATPSLTNTPIPPTVTFTRTPVPTATATVANTITNTPVPTPTVTNTLLPTATATNTPLPTATVTMTPLPTATNTPLPPTNTRPPTATNAPELTATPTVTLTKTPVPASTNTLRPTATTTPLPTVTATRTPLPTATVTNTALPTATVTNTVINTVTNTPQPTATNTPRPTATNTPRPTVTNTPRPIATNTPRPTATFTNTPRPTATKTNTPRPTATNTPVPTVTATNTPLPTATATNTPLPTATMTLLPTATNTPLPPPTNTRPPTATNTPELTATPTAIVGVIDPIAPPNGESGGGQRVFSWSANFTPPPNTAFELVFWKPGQNPIANSIGLAAPTTNLNVTLDLERLDEQLGAIFDTGEYNWGVLLVRTTPAYERVKYLGGGRTFTYYRGGDSGSGGPSSGE